MLSPKEFASSLVLEKIQNKNLNPLLYFSEKSIKLKKKKYKDFDPCKNTYWMFYFEWNNQNFLFF